MVCPTLPGPVDSNCCAGATLYTDQVEPSERSFDFSKLPNIQRVDFGVHWASGDILWIPIALSTLRPTTSPRIFDIRLNFSLRSTTNRSVETLLNDAGRGLRLVADEFARIKREFGGAVYLSVGRDPTFGVALRTLNVRFRLCGINDPNELFDPFLADPSALLVR